MTDRHRPALGHRPPFGPPPRWSDPTLLRARKTLYILLLARVASPHIAPCGVHGYQYPILIDIPGEAWHHARARLRPVMPAQIYAFTAAGPLSGENYVRYLQAFKLDNGKIEFHLRNGAGIINTIELSTVEVAELAQILRDM